LTTWSARAAATPASKTTEIIIARRMARNLCVLNGRQ
jgi:hypothetical protein